MLEAPPVCSQDAFYLWLHAVVGVQGNLFAFRGLPSHPTAVLATPIADLRRQTG